MFSSERIQIVRGKGCLVQKHERVLPGFFWYQIILVTRVGPKVFHRFHIYFDRKLRCKSVTFKFTTGIFFLGDLHRTNTLDYYIR